MAKRYTYINTQTNRVLLDSVEPNYVSIEDMDKRVLEETGQDPRLNPHIIQRNVRAVKD